VLLTVWADLGEHMPPTSSRTTWPTWWHGPGPGPGPPPERRLTGPPDVGRSRAAGMSAARGAVLVAGIAVLLSMRPGRGVLIVPGRAPAVAYPMRMVRAVFRASPRWRDLRAKDRILASASPWPDRAARTWLGSRSSGSPWSTGASTDLAQPAFSEAGSSVFTLASPQPPGGSRFVDFVAAATGLCWWRCRSPICHALQRLQPPRDTGHPAREPGRGAGVGPSSSSATSWSGSSTTFPACSPSGSGGRRRGGEPHELPLLLYLRPPPRTRGWSASSPSWTPRLSWPSTRRCAGGGPAVPEDGFTCCGTSPRPPGPLRGRSEPRRPHRPPRGEFASACAAWPRSATQLPPGRRGVAPLPGWRSTMRRRLRLATRLNAPRPVDGPRRLFPAESLEPARPVDRQPTAGA